MSVIKKISYICVIGENGLTLSTSFGKTVDITTLKIGDKIQNLYDKEFYLYNIFDDEYYITKKGIQKNSKLDNFKKVQEKIIKLIELMYSAPTPELHLKNKNNKTYYENLIFHINEGLDTPFPFKKIKWSLSKYIQLHNEIYFEVTKLSSKHENLVQLFEGLSACFNALLYHNGIFKSNKGGRFPKLEEDGTISDFSIKNEMQNIEFFASLISENPKTSSHDEKYINELIDHLIKPL